MMTKKLNQEGVGVEWTNALENEILDHLDQFDFVELIPENFFNQSNENFLNQLARRGTPVLVHSVEMSLGSEEPFKRKHFEKIKRVIGAVNTLNYSEHLCFTEAGGVEIGQLTPLPFTEECCDVVSRKIETVKKEISVPFLIENIANRFVVPDPEMSETNFINRVVERTGCGLLLDLHNVHANATNFHYDPFWWVDEINLAKVEGIHLAGGHFDEEGTLVDSHSAKAPRRVWDLYRYVCERVRPSCTIVEWTDAPPQFPTLLGEVETARAILEQTCPNKVIPLPVAQITYPYLERGGSR